jgi:hypothetical protein
MESVRYLNTKSPKIRVYVEPEDPENPKDVGHWIRFYGGISPTITSDRDLETMERAMSLDRSFSRIDEGVYDNPEEDLSEYRCDHEGCTYSTTTPKKLSLHKRVIHKEA